MEKVNVKILDFEDKKTKDGKRYTRFKTTDEWMSCFDFKVCEILKELDKDMDVCLEIARSEPNADGKVFSNIRGIAKAGDTATQPQGEKSSSVAPTSRPAHNTATMYVSYAKDIFIALKEDAKNTDGFTTYENLMKIAIDVVKQARVEFEK